MIYLIESAAFIGDTDNMEKMLKIGYTKDERGSKRFSVYTCHNPTIRVLSTVKDGSEEIEKKLHVLFFKHLKYFREWFSWDNEIIEFFKIHTTKQDLEVAVKNVTIFSPSEAKINLKKQEIKEVIEKAENKEVFNKFFYEFTNYIDRMKLLCDNLSNISDHDLDLFPEGYTIFIKTIGKDKIRALSYQKSKLEAEYDIVKSNSSITKSIRDVIYEKFTVGEKYTLKEIKESLGDIYKEFGYKATPKATDLGEYFEVKACQVIKKGVRDYCLKLIKRKEV